MICDPEDSVLLTQYNYSHTGSGSVTRPSGSAGRGKRVSLGQDVAERAGIAYPVKYLDGNRANCRRGNLAALTAADLPREDVAGIGVLVHASMSDPQEEVDTASPGWMLDGHQVAWLKHFQVQVCSKAGSDLVVRDAGAFAKDFPWAAGSVTAGANLVVAARKFTERHGTSLRSPQNKWGWVCPPRRVRRFLEWGESGDEYLGFDYRASAIVQGIKGPPPTLEYRGREYLGVVRDGAWYRATSGFRMGQAYGRAYLDRAQIIYASSVMLYQALFDRDHHVVSEALEEFRSEGDNAWKEVFYPVKSDVPGGCSHLVLDESVLSHPDVVGLWAAYARLKCLGRDHWARSEAFLREVQAFYASWVA